MKIYELVINNDPCYAYLLEGNENVDQKLVMARVRALRLLQEQLWFSRTNAECSIPWQITLDSPIPGLGITVVEEFIDTCLSIENLIDLHRPYRPKKKKKQKA